MTEDGWTLITTGAAGEACLWTVPVVAESTPWGRIKVVARNAEGKGLTADVYGSVTRWNHL